MPKSNYVQFRVTEEEKDILTGYAKKENRTLSNYLLSLVFRCNGKIPPSEVASGYELFLTTNPSAKIMENKSYLDVLKELSNRFKSGKWKKNESYTIAQSGTDAAIISYTEAEQIFG